MNFKINRFLALIQRDFILYNKLIFFISAAIVFVLTILLFLNADGQFHTYQPYYVIGFLVVGAVFTASSFPEFRNPSDRISFLSLPASSLEKFLSRLLFCTIGFFIYWVVLFGISHFLANSLISYFTYNGPYEMYNPLSILDDHAFKFWLSLQSGFFIFSILFNRFSFFKALLTMIPIMIIYVLILFLLTGFIYNDFFSIIGGELGSYKIRGLTFDTTKESNKFFNASLRRFKFIMHYCLPPFFLVVAFLKLTEKEA